MIGGVTAGLFVLGLWSVAVGVREVRRPRLVDRVAPYVRDLRPLSTPLPTGLLLREWVAPWWRTVTRIVGESLGSNAAVTRRLERCGATEDLDGFRVRQAIWGAAGLTGAVAVALFAWTIARPPVTALLPLCVAGVIGGCLACDQRLAARVRSHEARIRAEFPTIAELLALAVAAGESPVQAIERVTRVSRGALSRELERVVAQTRAGDPIVTALDDLVVRTGVTGVARFAEAMAVAIDRGTPLVDVLHAQAGDVRDAGRRELMEAGGRREIAMMVPVVFLILPVTIVFAFYPGLAGLHLTSGG